MSPAEKQLALFSVLGVVSLAIYYFPILLYITLILAFFYIVLYYHGEESLPARLGLNPRAGAHIQSVLRRWVWAWGVSSGSVPLRGREKLSSSKSRRPAREPEEHCGQRFAHTGLYRQEALASDSFLFSPRDLLMGSYIARAESPPAGSLRARAPRNPREQLRDNLAKPNYAVYTPNRRLSFTGEPLGPGARFTITPQRHYPLQQQGASPVGVLPPVRWDGFRQKSILSPRNTSVSSPVTVKIARPDCHTASLDHLGSPVFPNADVDPCSRESVLKVLKESRKREVEDEDRNFTAEQRSKRRRNDSGGSAQSAFEPLLPNGTSTQLIPKPGSLKRGLAAGSEDMSVKRSRTSSVSSGSGVPALRGTPGSRRNPISSSYSSSQGLGQWKRPLAAASPLSSPGPSRCQTPEGGPKKIREEDMQSPSSVPSVKPDNTSERLPVLDKSTSPPKDPGTSSTERAASGGKRRRKIQLVSREDNLSLPPPPELGYSITAKDLDEEKQTAFNKIQKILETPAPEPEPASSSLPSSVCSSNILTSTFASSGSAGTGGGLSVSAGTGGSLRISTETDGGGLSTSAGTGGGLSASAGTGGGLSVSASTGGGGLSVSAGTGGGLSITAGTSGSTTPSLSSASTAPAQFNILLESLKRKSSPAASSVPATSAATVPASSAQNEPSEALKTSLPASTPLVPPATAASEQPPAPGLFSRQPAVTASSSTATTAAASITTPLLASGFKPIFNPISTTSSSTATESKPLQNFRPIFGTASESSVSAPSSTAPTASLFGGSSSSTSAPLAFTPTTVPSTVSSSTESGVRPEFGSWSAPSTSAQSSSGSVLQFPSALTTSAGANTSSSSQSGVTFGQTSTTQSSTAASFGGFESTATTSQSTFTFGKSSLETSSAQPSFSTMVEPPKPFTFGESSSTPASNSAPFTLGQSAPTTAAPSFGTPAKPTFAFGSSTTAASNFGAPTATAAQSSSTFAFGSSAQQPSTSNAPTSTPFKFGAAPGPQFGTPVVNNTALQIGTFTFGAGTTDKSAFGTSNPMFGQNSTPAPIPFVSPGTPGQGFSAVPFGSPATPSFSIGAGSKPSATRQRLQARRQHTRKK